MNENWLKCLELVRQSEGGNNDDPDDPGGRTSRGITQGEYDAYCRINDLPAGDVWQAPEMCVTRIYHDYYWRPHCDGLGIGVDYCFFDMSVNHGPYRATVILQRALKVDDDGHIGIITKTAESLMHPAELIERITVRRKTFYRQIRTYRKFGKGWVKRAEFVRENALKMVQQVVEAQS